MKKKRYYVDGSGYNNVESRACVTNDAGTVLAFVRFGQSRTNNEMEYQGLITCLLMDIPKESEIMTDSQLLVGQLTKGWKVNFEHLRIYVDACKELIAKKRIKLTWIPRRRNKAGIVLEKEAKI